MKAKEKLDIIDRLTRLESEVKHINRDMRRHGELHDIEGMYCGCKDFREQFRRGIIRRNARATPDGFEITFEMGGKEIAVCPFCTGGILKEIKA